MRFCPRCHGDMLPEPSDGIYARSRSRTPEPTYVCLLCGERIEPPSSGPLPKVANLHNSPRRKNAHAT